MARSRSRFSFSRCALFFFALFAFAFPFALFLFLFQFDLELLLLGQRDLRRDFLAGAPGAVLEAFQFGVEEGADREVVRVADHVVELVRVLVDVVELFLAVRPLDVLVGAEADPVVVLRRRDHGGVGGGFLPDGGALAPFRPSLPRDGPSGAFGRFGRRRVAVLFDVVGLHEGLEEQRPPRAQLRFFHVRDERDAVDALVRGDFGEFEDRRRDVDRRDQLAGRGVRFDPRAADDQRQVGRGLVGEELAADQAVLAEEEAVVGGEDDVGVAQPAERAELVDDLFDPFVDRDQRVEAVLVVDAVGVDFGRAEVGRFADEAGLVVDVALVEAFGAVVGQRRAGEAADVTGRRLRPGRFAEVPVRRGVVDLHVERLFRRGRREFFGRQLVELVGLVVTGFAVQRRVGAAGVVDFAVFARFPAAGVAVGPFDHAVVVHQVAVGVVVGVRVEDRVPGAPAGRDFGAGAVGRVAVAVEDLADVDRPVAGALQPGREVVRVGEAGLEAGPAAVRRDVALDVVVVGVAAGEEADAGRGAERVGRVVAGEGDAFFAEQRSVFGIANSSVPLRMWTAW